MPKPSASPTSSSPWEVNTFLDLEQRRVHTPCPSSPLEVGELYPPECMQPSSPCFYLPVCISGPLSVFQGTSAAGWLWTAPAPDLWWQSAVGAFGGCTQKME